MRTAVGVAVLGALGALARYGIGVAVGGRGGGVAAGSFPWPTFAINVLGSFLLGLVLTWGASVWSRDVVVAVGVGFLGAFTTFSTFGYETQSLLRGGRGGVAAAYVAASVLVGVAAAWAGWSAGQQLSSR